LIFPHHEDEIAQSEAVTGKPFVRYWVHNAHLLVEGKKMSKSLGNFYTLRDLLAKGWTGREIRSALICGHYREQLNFTFDGLQAARSALQRIDEFLLRLQELLKPAPAPEVAIGCPAVEQVKLRFETALDDDLNISGALGALFDFIRDVNRRLTEDHVSVQEALLILDGWKEFDTVLGLGIPQKELVPREVLQLAVQRREARKAKNFKRADEIRDHLLQMGWVVEDLRDGGFGFKRAD